MSTQLDTAEMPELAVYLKRTTSILKLVQFWMPVEGPSRVKFNHSLCNYLADKLRKAVNGADMFFKLLGKANEARFSPEEKAKFLEIFKLLHAFATQAGTFIEECCNESWLQAAWKLTNVTEHVLAMAFNLELWTNVCQDRREWRENVSNILETDLVCKLIDDETAAVKEKALSDKDSLLKQVEAVLDPSSTSGIKEYQLAKDLLKQLKRIPPGSVGSCFEGFEEQDCSAVTQSEMLGKGNFGTVFKGKYRGLDIAKKTVHKGTDPCDFMKEVSILAQMSHSNILSLHCYTVDGRSLSIIMPIMEKALSSLMDERLKDGREFPFTSLVAVDIMSQVAWGMCFVHKMKIGHRGLKSENILVKLVATTEYLLVKIADFGVSKVAMIGEENDGESAEIDVTPNVGTLRWKAPEQIQPAGTGKVKMPREEAFTKVAKSDVHSFAMVCYEILTGNLPYDEFPNYEIRRRILNGERPVLPECHSKLKVLIERCWSPDASKRPCFEEICRELEYVKCELLMTSAWGSTLIQSMIGNASEDYISEFFEAVMSERGTALVQSEYFSACSVSELQCASLRDSNSSREQGLSEFSDRSEYLTDQMRGADRMHFEDFKHRYPGFFQDMDDLELGGVIAEGGQAILYEACCAAGEGYSYVAKVFIPTVEGFSVKDYLASMPVGLLNAFMLDSREESPLSLIRGATLLKDGRFAVLMPRKWGDLRTLINLRLRNQERGLPPFTWEEVTMIMLDIAKDMISLLSQSPPILHRDLKAANVLVQCSDDTFEITEVTVCDFEANQLVNGTGFWRAPEILENRLKRPADRLDVFEVFTEKTDVYSYGMLCYELATGHIPFLGYTKHDWKSVIGGERPHLPSYVHPVVEGVITRCWQKEPSLRPTFHDIVDVIARLNQWVELGHAWMRPMITSRVCDHSMT